MIMVYNIPMIQILQHGGLSYPFDTIVEFDSISMGLGEVLPGLSSTFSGVVLPEPLEQLMICTRPKVRIAFLLIWAIGQSKHSLLV